MASSSVSDRFITPLLVCLCVLAAGVGINAATLPAGFTETLVSNGLSNPTAMEFAPDGRLFVCQQGGQLRVIKNGALLSTPFLSLAVDSSGERGLLGIAFDPNFSSNNFVYVYYTNGTASPRHNQVSRFTANGDVAVAGSELVILTLDNLSGAANHNGGAVHFGPDGKLYVAVGENANSSNSQTLNNRLGKLLRINSDGSIPTDNPFYNTATGLNRVIWSMGLRNPYTFAFQPNSGRMFINDVGRAPGKRLTMVSLVPIMAGPLPKDPRQIPVFDRRFLLTTTPLVLRVGARLLEGLSTTRQPLSFRPATSANISLQTFAAVGFAYWILPTTPQLVLLQDLQPSGPASYGRWQSLLSRPRCRRCF